MSEKILVPALGESITEATISKWLKNKGESINADEPIVELETDKVNLEVPSPINGVLSEINFNNGDTVEVGATLGIISDSKTETVKIEKKEIKQKSSNIVSIKKEKKQETKLFNEVKIKQEKNNDEPLVLTNEIKESQKTLNNQTHSPAVRKIIEENNIDVQLVKGSWTFN